MNEKDRADRLVRLKLAEKCIAENSQHMRPISSEEDVVRTIKDARLERIEESLASETDDRLQRLEVARKNIAERAKKMRKCSIPVEELIESTKEDRSKDFLALEKDQ